MRLLKRGNRLVRRSVERVKGVRRTLETIYDNLTREPFNRHGGLTLAYQPDFEELAEILKIEIEKIGKKRHRKTTPVDVRAPGHGDYQNREPYCRLGKDNIGGHDVTVLTSGPGTFEMIGQLLWLLNNLAGRRASRIAVVSAYYPHCRSDKDEDEVFAMPAFIHRLMTTAARGKLDRVISADLHAPQVVMAGNSGEITEVTLMRVLLRAAIADALAEGWRLNQITLHFTDSGSLKRFRKQIARIEKDCGHTFAKVYGDKERTSSKDAKILALSGDVDKIKGSLVLSIDDEMATCTTLMKSANSIVDDHKAAAIWSVVIHGVLRGAAVMNMRGEGDEDWQIERSYIMDTIPVKNRSDLAAFIKSGQLRVVSWAYELAEIIYFHHWDENLREMR